MVMGGDSCLEGRGFESQDCILDGYFAHIFMVKIAMLKCIFSAHTSTGTAAHACSGIATNTCSGYAAHTVFVVVLLGRLYGHEPTS